MPRLRRLRDEKRAMGPGAAMGARMNKNLTRFVESLFLACVAAVSFPFPNAREREENCERVAK